jgi:hypothetical protein
MFTGFASENTPAIQVWDFFNQFASPTSNRSIFLADDCAPIQYFKTGATTTGINLFLPSAPIEGRQLKLINTKYSTSNQFINIYSSDVNNGGTGIVIYTLGAGQTLDLCYSKNFISSGSFAAITGSTGWISLNQSPASSPTGTSVAFGLYNHAAGAYSFVAGGTSNVANAAYSAVVGGTNNQAGGGYSSTVGSVSSNSSGTYAAILGGNTHTADGESSVVVGGYRGTSRSIVGNTIFPASGSPISGSVGVSQTGLLVLGRQTTDATATVLRSNTSAAGTFNQVILPNNSAYFFRGEVIAGVTGAGDSKGWTIEGVIKRGATAASTVLVGTPTVTSSYADAGAATWAITATADTTNGGLAITVTGQTATTIRWVAQIRTTEMTF